MLGVELALVAIEVRLGLAVPEGDPEHIGVPQSVVHAHGGAGVLQVETLLSVTGVLGPPPQRAREEYSEAITQQGAGLIARSGGQMLARQIDERSERALGASRHSQVQP